MAEDSNGKAAGISLGDVFNALELLQDEGFQWSKRAIKSATGYGLNPVQHQLLEPKPGRLYISTDKDGVCKSSEITEFQLNTIFSLVNPVTREGAQIWFGQSKDEIEQDVGDAILERGPLGDKSKQVSLSIPEYISLRQSALQQPSSQPAPRIDG